MIKLIDLLFEIKTSMPLFNDIQKELDHRGYRGGRKISRGEHLRYIIPESDKPDEVIKNIMESLGVKEKNYSRVLLIGILMAILFRIIFITLGVELVAKFHWILYIFGAFLVYTGVKMFKEEDEKEFMPTENSVYKFLNKILPLNPTDGNGKFIIQSNGKKQYTILFVVVILLASIDLVFALDSIPAVMGISQDRLVIYTSNIFAVLGLRSLFFLLRNAVNKFKYLQHGIAIVLVLIGIKMLAEKLLDQWTSKNEQVMYSLITIVICIGGSIINSIAYNRKNNR